MNKTVYTLLGSFIFLLFLSYVVWKKKELDIYRKVIHTLDDQLVESKYNRIAHSKLYSAVYLDFFNKQSSIQKMTGNKSSVLIYSRYLGLIPETFII